MNISEPSINLKCKDKEFLYFGLGRMLPNLVSYHINFDSAHQPGHSQTGATSQISESRKQLLGKPSPQKEKRCVVTLCLYI